MQLQLNLVLAFYCHRKICKSRSKVNILSVERGVHISPSITRILGCTSNYTCQLEHPLSYQYSRTLFNLLIGTVGSHVLSRIFFPLCWLCSTKTTKKNLLPALSLGPAISLTFSSCSSIMRHNLPSEHLLLMGTLWAIHLKASTTSYDTEETP